MNVKAASDFSVETKKSYNEIYTAIKEIINANAKDLESVFITLSNNPVVRSYFLGSDVLSSGNTISNSNCVVIGNITASKGYCIGDTITVFDHEYIICGIRAMRDYDEISYFDYFNELEITSIHFRWNHIPTEKNINYFETCLNNQFGDCTISSPSNYSLLRGIFKELKTTFFIACTAVFNMIFVFSYLIGIKSTDYSVFFICGASTLKLSICAMKEFVIYAIIGNLIGDSLFVTFLYKEQTAARGFLWQGLSVSFMFCLIIGLIISIPYLLYTFKKDVLRKGTNDV